MRSPNLSELPPPPPGKTGWPWMRENRRHIAVQEYALEVQARRYVVLYKSMLFRISEEL